MPCSRDNVDEVTDVVMQSKLVTKFSFTGSTVVGKVSFSGVISLTWQSLAPELELCFEFVSQHYVL